MNILLNAEAVTVFRSFNEWVNKAASRIGGYDKDRFHLLCIDNDGNVCMNGADFREAAMKDRFPVTAYLIQRSNSAPKTKDKQPPYRAISQHFKNSNVADRIEIDEWTGDVKFKSTL